MATALDKLKSGYWSLNLISPCSYRSSQQLIQLIRLQLELLPKLTPQKWDNFEPISYSFDVNTFEQLIPDSIEAGIMVMWQRRLGVGKSAQGEWNVGVAPNFPNPLALKRHSSLYVRSNDFSLQPELVQFLQTMPARMRADIGLVDTVSLDYRDVGIKNDTAPYGDAYSFTTHTLRHWLPDMLWGMVFGPPYVRMFGLEKLLSAPAHSVVQIGPEMVYIQLTEDLRDNELRFDRLQAKRLEVKTHLGLEHFWSADKTYEWREHPELAGKVFKVPEFDLWPDPAPGMADRLQNWMDRVRPQQN